MTAYRIEKCRSCQAPIVWAKTSPSDEFMPLDAEPTAEGNAEVIDMRSGVPVVVVHATPPLVVTGDLMMPHFATCPHGKEWSNRKRVRSE